LVKRHPIQREFYSPVVCHPCPHYGTGAKAGNTGEQPICLSGTLFHSHPLQRTLLKARLRTLLPSPMPVSAYRPEWGPVSRPEYHREPYVRATLNDGTTLDGKHTG
jgi:hypothetical protein